MASAISTEEKIKRDLLECPVCQDSFDENRKVPRHLPCQHTFCTSCLNKLNKNGIITCPNCRTAHALNGNAITDYPKDNTRRGLMELLKPHVQKCVMCEEDQIATHVCNTCDEHMCLDCTTSHRKQKRTKNHVVESLNNETDTASRETETSLESEETLALCDVDDHNRSEIISYCKRCSVLLCQRCIEERHVGHASMDIGDAYRVERETLQRLVTESGQHSPNTTVERCRLLVENVHTASQTLKDNIKLQFETYKQLLSDRYDDLVNRIDTLSANRVTSLRMIEEQHEKTKYDHGTALNHAKDLLKTENGKVTFLGRFGDAFKPLEGLHKRLPMIPDASMHYNQACTTDDFQKIVTALGNIMEVTGESETNGNDENNHSDQADVISETGFLKIDHSSHSLVEALQSVLETKGQPSLKEVRVDKVVYARDKLQDGQPQANDEITALQCNKLETVTAKCRPPKVPNNMTGSQDTSKQYENDTNKGSDNHISQKRTAEYQVTRTENLATTALAGALQSRNVRDVVNARLDTWGLEGNWEIKGNELIVCSKTNLMAERCLQLLMDAMHTKTLNIRDECINALESDKWQMRKAELQKRFVNQVWIAVSRETMEIVVCATCPSVLQCVYDAVQIFIRDNQVHVICMTYKESIVHKITKQTARLKSIQASYSQFGVYIESRDKTTIKIQGIGLGLAKAAQQVHILASSPLAGVHVGDEEDRFSSDDKLNSDDSERFSDDEEAIDAQVQMKLVTGPNEVALNAICFPGDNCVIYVVTGDITMLPVEAIVSPADPKLKHNGGLAKVLVSKGGWCIQAECLYRVQKEGELSAGQTYCSGSGALPFRAIIHAVSSKWENGQDVATTKLSAVVNSALQTGARRMISSIAFPAIGSGAYKVPVDVSTNTIVQTVNDFLIKNPHSGLSNVYFCDISIATVNEFVLALKKHFEMADVLVSQDDNNDILPVVQEVNVVHRGEHNSLLFI